jgi:uncharacterized repeat protein (TIGR01451 family)
VPALQLEVFGPAALNLGKPLTYEIVVRNTGAAAAAAVRVEDEVPAGARCLGAEPRPEVHGDRLIWNLGSLEPGAERRLKVELQPAGEGELTSTASVTFAASAPVRTRITRPRLTLAMTGPERVQVGDAADFQLQVSNPGTGPATGVVLAARLPAGLQHPQGDFIQADLGTLAPGETRSVTLQTTAVKAGRHVNQAQVIGEESLMASAQAAVGITEPILAVRLSGPQRCFLDRETEFRLEVSNTGTAPATSVWLTDVLPEGLEFLSASDGGVLEPTARAIGWALGTLPAGQTRGVTVRLRTKAPGDLINRALVQADRGLEVRAEAPLRVEGVPALLLEVVDLDDPVEAGAETTYEIRVVNQGSAASTGVQILATVPEGMVALSADGPVPHRLQGQQVVFEPVAKLAARADALYRVRVRSHKPGDWRFSVQMTSEQLRVPVHEEESTRVYKD